MRDLSQEELAMVDGAGIAEAWDKVKETAKDAWEGIKDAWEAL